MMLIVIVVATAAAEEVVLAVVLVLIVVVIVTVTVIVVVVTVTPLYPGYKAQYRLYLLCFTVSLWHMNLYRLIYRSGGRAGLRLFTSDAATSKNA